VNSNDEIFYVCLYLKDGRAVGHRVNFQGTFPATADDPTPDTTSSTKTEVSRFRAASNEFIDTMMGYLEYVPLILTLTPFVSHTMVANALREFLDKQCASCDRSNDRIIYKLSRHDFGAYRRFDENLSAAASTSRSLPRLLTVGLVTSLEYHLTFLMKEVAKKFPREIFGKDKVVAARDIVKFNSMDDLKEFVIYDEIDKVQRESLADQIKWITSKAGLDDITPNYPDWSRLLELFERRNLFVHANGIVNEQYVKAAKKHDFPDGKSLKTGDELHANPDYFTQAVHRVIHFGAMLTQIVWRRCYPEEGEYSDKSISDLGYELIARQQFELAIKMLEAAKTTRGISEIRNRMSVVNLANAYKLSGDEERSLKVLESMDWTAVAPEFKISIAAVRGDVDEVVTLMKRIGVNDDLLSARAYQEWPVFYGVRGHVKFTSAFKEIFRLDYEPIAKEQAGLSQVLSWAKVAKVDKAPDEKDEPSFLDNAADSKPRILN
jgi:hypothetical protein